jgi:hypothetical protein
MTFETVMNLAAVSLPGWLVAEQINSWRRSRRTPRGQAEPPTVSGGGSLAGSNAGSVPTVPQRKAA